MERYHSIVVGGGISGLTLAHLLAANGRKVLLLEKAPMLGGALCRFRRRGVPFDTGFHFTGGFVGNTTLHDMLTVLGLRDRVRPYFLDGPCSNQFLFEDAGLRICVPAGLDRCRDEFERVFPEERPAVRTYFEKVGRVIKATPSFDLRRLATSPEPIEEDFVTLQSVLDGLTRNPTLKAALALYCLCYGSRPDEVSFANHARVSVGFYDTIARIEDGGDAFVQAFQAAFQHLPVEVRCNETLAECLDIRGEMVGRFRLASGAEVEADDCIFTIHPHEVLKLLPREHFSKAFWNRVESFDSSNGFFCVYGVAEGDAPGPEFEPTIQSILPHAEINRLMDPAYDGPQALAVFQTRELVGGKPVRVINALEPSFFPHVAAWRDSRRGKRPAEYQAYKARRTEMIRERVGKIVPEVRDSFKVYSAASMLTFRDYLNTPDGSAYGIRQKVGQFNLFGKLPLRNLYAAGQSAVLPGILGAMLSSFIVARSVLDRQAYAEFVGGRLCR